MNAPREHETMHVVDGAPAQTNESGAKRRRQLVAWLALVYGAPWVVYLLLLWRQPPDPFVAWHEDVAWPAEHFLTHSQGGLVMPIFGHVMVGTVGGMFAAVVAAAIFRAVGRIVDRRDFGGSAAVGLLLLMPFWAFVLVKAIPETVTVVDRQAKRVEIHHFQLLLRYPTGHETIAGSDMRALDLTSRWRKREGDRSLRMLAHTRDGRVVELGERICNASDQAKCLAEGDADLVRLAEWLGTAGAQVVTNSSLHQGVVMRQ